MEMYNEDGELTAEVDDELHIMAAERGCDRELCYDGCDDCKQYDNCCATALKNAIAWPKYVTKLTEALTS